MAVADYFPFLAHRLPRGLRGPRSKHVGETGAPLHGILGEFPDVASVYHAAERVRDAGHTTWDVHSPFPIHGIDHAMGFKRTKLPLLVGMIGLGGAGLGYGLQWLISAVLYPMVVQGKPYGAWEPFTPITFEIGVLHAAFAALIGMLAMNGLPRFHHPLYSSERFLGSSDDRFFIYVEATDPRFEPATVRSLLTGAGAERIELIEDA